MNKKFFRIPLFFTIIVLLVFTAVGCGKSKPIPKVQLNSTTVTLSVGETYQLKSVATDSASSATIIWVPKNPEIASIDKDGLITALSPGQATMQAFFSNSSVENSVECVVTIEAKNVEGILISESNLTLKAGDSSSLVATVIPEEALNKNIFWTSSDESIVSVDQSGNISALASGVATIDVVAESGGFSASCVVSVEQSISGL
ncbi:MAG: Ig-like domain-containing protein, partial [Oscillospiraceae bacterium]